MKRARLAMVVVALSLLAGEQAQAESKWSLKKLMPSFAKKNDAPKGLYPPAQKPSMFRKMNNGTKAFFAKSKAAVPPWLMPETQARVRKSGEGLRQGSEKVRGEVRTARRNIFAPWGQAEKKESNDRPETVSDWLALPKP